MAREQLQDWHHIHTLLLTSMICRRGDGCSEDADNATTTSRAISWQTIQRLFMPTHGVSTMTRTAISTHQALQDDCEKDPVVHWKHVEATMRGRKAADAAFWFALAGVTDPTIYTLLTAICVKELERFGHKASCRSKEILDIVERLAAAGIRTIDDGPANAEGNVAKELESIARVCLECLDQTSTPASLKTSASMSTKATTSKLTILSSTSLLSLHADHTAMRIWNFSTRQRKQRDFLQMATQHWQQQQQQQQHQQHRDLEQQNQRGQTSTISLPTDAEKSPQSMIKEQDEPWFISFADPYRPLVVDIGCGMGVSLLGLASHSRGTNNRDYSLNSTCSGNNTQPELDEWSQYNFVGVDLSSLTINYARGLAQRWNLQDRVQFHVDSAEAFLDRLLHLSPYPGGVARILIQFPTPYRLPSSLDDWNEWTAKKSCDVIPMVEAAVAKTTTSGRNNLSGNSQLPISPLKGFMASPRLFQLAYQLLCMQQPNKNEQQQQQQQQQRPSSQQQLLLQSNCEDVAIWMQRIACQDAGFRVCQTNNDYDMIHDIGNEMSFVESGGMIGCSAADNIRHQTKRTMDWITMGGERATFDIGGWSCTPLLPRMGRTETEIACILQNTPIHRCWLCTSTTTASTLHNNMSIN